MDEQRIKTLFEELTPVSGGKSFLADYLEDATPEFQDNFFNDLDSQNKQLQGETPAEP